MTTGSPPKADYKRTSSLLSRVIMRSSTPSAPSRSPASVARTVNPVSRKQNEHDAHDNDSKNKNLKKNRQNQMESYWENEFHRQSLNDKHHQVDHKKEKEATTARPLSIVDDRSGDSSPLGIDKKKYVTNRIGSNTLQKQQPQPNNNRQNQMIKTYWEKEFHHESLSRKAAPLDDPDCSTKSTRTPRLPQQEDFGKSDSASKQSTEMDGKSGDNFDIDALQAIPTNLDRASTRTGSLPGAFRERGPDYSGQSERLADIMDEELMAIQEPPLADDPSDELKPRASTSSAALLSAGSVDHDLDHQTTHQSQESLATAMEVSDTEAVFYAQDVQHDPINFRKAMLRCLVIDIVLSMILSVFLIRNNGDKQQDDYGKAPILDSRCESTPLEHQNPALQCRCYNTTEQILNSISEPVWDFYDDLLHSLADASVFERNETINLTDCTSKSNSMLGILQTAEFGIEQGMLDSSEIPALLQTAPHAFGLFALYNSLGGLDWTNSSGWGEFLSLSGKPVFGVDYFFVRIVTSISLPNNNLQGTIPSEIRVFSSLRALDFSNNPGLVGTIPPDLGSMVAMKGLRLSETGLEGSIPIELGRLERLDVLEMRNTKLYGSIPPDFFTPLLRVLDLSRNQLTGTLPSSISKSSRLQALILTDNQLSGTLPGDALGKLTDLETLNVAVNQFSGAIPSELGTLACLEFSSYIESGLAGSIPESFCETASALTRQMIGDCAGDDSLELECSCCSNYEQNSRESGVVTTCSEDYPEFLVDNLYRIRY